MIARIGGKKVVIDVPDTDEKKGFNVVTKSVFSTDKLERLGWRAQIEFQYEIVNTIKEEKLIGNV